ncbi:uncharacterized protein [Oryza sativa Japonica Group]|uniref:Retrotransposon gag domain-containing protein n=1 Tax=Oryza sativa subsp. japonica TaxID=39947 RepID=Q94H30_ORYSJ|nr:hypothetical protein [Oryza sativa Japonica Group]
MADKTLREFAAPSTGNVAIGPQINMGDVDFDLKSSLIMMAQACPFCGEPNEDANAHLQQFLEICITYTIKGIKGVSPDAVRLRLFLFFLLGKTKQWFYANRAVVNIWDKCSTAFLSKFFPMGKTNALGGRISSFQLTRVESIPEAWERLQEYVAVCPHHGMDGWLILQNFYNGLTPMSRDHLDAAAEGSFFSKVVRGAVDLIEKMVSNMGWSEERLQTHQRGMCFVKETELLAAKLDLLMKRLDDHDKRPQGTIKALDSHVTCEVCGGTGHSGNDCLETREDAMYMGNNNNGNRPRGVPATETGRIPEQTDSSIENVMAITTRGGKSTRDPPYPNPAGTNRVAREAPSSNSADKEVQPEKAVPQEYCDTRLLPFHQRSRKPSVDEQFARFVEVIQKIHINVPLDAMQVVKLTEQCSNVILHKLLEKKKDPGCPTITCSIGAQQFDQVLCDLGASVSVMPKNVFDKLNFTVLAPTPMRLQLADSLVRYPTGIAEDMLVKIWDFFIPVDFVVLDMDNGKETPLILGRPFLSTAGANIDVETRSIRFHINGKKEKFQFQPRTEQCSMVRIKYGPNPQNIQVVEVEPPKMDSLVKFMQNFLEKETTMPTNRYWKILVKLSTLAKKLEQSKPSSTPKPKKVWKEKSKTPTPLPPETGGKSVH